MVAPFAVKVAELPEQMLAEFTLTVGVIFTLTVVVVTFVHVPTAPVILYVCVNAGLAVTTLPVALLREEDGLHV